MPLWALAGVSLLAAGDGAAGIRWSVPRSWTAQAPRHMRVATYSVPGVKGSAPGECGVFYFGKGHGGGVEENFDRWAAQFEGAAPPKKGLRTVGSFKVHSIRLSGTYLDPGGPQMQSRGRRPGYQLLGAIVEAPEGLVFFKCTGPAETLRAAEPDFEKMIDSLARGNSTAL